MTNEEITKPKQFGEGETSSDDNLKKLQESKSSYPDHLDCSTPPIKSKNEVMYKKKGANERNSGSVDIIESSEIFQSSEQNGLGNGYHLENAAGLQPLEPTKSLDPNRYATKKTIAQGMLDIALLTANASQLKYILQVGKQHEFYTLMLTLICLSIGLQVVQGLICLILGSSFNINKQKDQKFAEIWNNIVMTMMLLTVVTNIVISVFELSDGENATGNTANITSIIR